MNIHLKMSEHWTDEQLIEHLYGVGPENDHVRSCADCSGRLTSMQSSRYFIEQTAGPADDITFEALAAQRRRIHARIDQPTHWVSGAYLRRLASVTAAVLVVGGGLAFFERGKPLFTGTQLEQADKAKISDAQLVSDVSQLADELEPQSTAPLQSLFED